MSNVSKHLVLAEAEDGESEHFMPFPPIVWLTIDDVIFFFNLLSHALYPGNSLAGTRINSVMAMWLMEVAVGFSFFLSLHKTLASLYFCQKGGFFWSLFRCCLLCFFCTLGCGMCE